LKILECLDTLRCFPFGPRQEIRQTDRQNDRMTNREPTD
jgi:hypothetical protein